MNKLITNSICWNKKASHLLKYQEDDVSFMVGVEKRSIFRGGINANEMGLGKTGMLYEY